MSVAFEPVRPSRSEREARSGNGQFPVFPANDERAAGRTGEPAGEPQPYEYHQTRDLTLSITKQETLVAALQGKIAAIMSELTAVLSASMIEEMVALQATEHANIAAILGREGAVLAALPGSPVPGLILSLRARRGDLAQAMAQLGQLRSQIAQAESRLSVAIGRSGSRFTLG